MKVSTLLPIIVSYILTTVVESLYGPLYIPIPALAYDVRMSENGQKMFFAQLINKEIIIMENNGYNFVESSKLGVRPKPNDFEVSQNSSTLVVCGGVRMQVFEIVNGTYEAIQFKRFKGRTINDCQLSIDGELLVIAFFDGYFQIYERGPNGFVNIQNILGSTAAYIAKIQESKNLLLTYALGNNKNVKIYQKQNSSFSLKEEIDFPYLAAFVAFNEYKIIISTYYNFFYVFLHNGTNFYQDQAIQYPGPINAISVTTDLQTVAVGGTTFLVNFYPLNNQTDQFQSFNISSYCISMSGARNNKYFSVGVFDSNLAIFYECPDQCATCSFPNNCSSCIDGFVLVGVQCVPKPTLCVKNEIEKGKVCKEYCSKKCKSCNQTKDDCYECADFYVRGSDGDCIMRSRVLSFATQVRFFFGIIRRGGLKNCFLLLDDLWLYEYQKKQYDGILKTIFQTIRFVEQKQWNLFFLAQQKEELERSLQVTSSYNVFSNQKYMSIERKNNVLVINTIPFFVFFIPLTIISVFLFNRIFYLLFDFEVSKYLRPYSFWLILIELIVINNIQFLTFLSFRAFDVYFSFDYYSKWFCILSVAVLFTVQLISFAGYSFIYSRYKKLARYFLVDMYRFPESYILMTILYGARPFLKGLTHALLYDHFVVQISILISIEIIALICVFVIQWKIENQKSTIFFMFESILSGCLIIMNVLILLKYEYYSSDKVVRQLLQTCIQVIVYSMLSILAIRFVYAFLPVDFVKSILKDDEEEEQQNEKSKKKTGTSNRETIEVDRVGEDEMPAVDEIENAIVQYYLDRVQSSS